uniref:AP-3 complex subunit delta n=1 Tax=Globodera rostochiensis TaxID=31243 RepID=A0A914HEH6_GLORO
MFLCRRSMQLVPDGTFRKVRNNIDRLFDKNLTDLIRGIRNNKENEARYIAACTEEIKLELRQDSIFVKANAIEKLAYIQMLGYDISWSAFNIIEVMSSTRYSEKRVGYLAAVQAFNDETDVLMLTTNLIRKDLQSSNIYDVGIALSGLACFATPDLSQDLVNDVVNLLSSSKPYVRKKAILLLLKDRLEDQDPGVQSAAVNVVCELARKNPRNYLGLQNVFFKLLNTSSNNWMLIKIIKLFGSLVPYEPKLGRKLLEPLTNLINSTSAMSLLYECINTVIAILISISSEGPGDYTPSIQLCVQKLGILIDDSDQNLKYLGLLAMGRILLTHPKAVQAHKDIVLRCLDDKDESIRLRALDLLYGMVSKKNIMEIVRRLMDHVDAAEGSFYRDELLQRIIAICSHDNYKYIANFEWYISVLVELTKVEGTKHGVLIAEQIQDVTVRVQSIRHFSVSQMALLVENAQPLLKGNGRQRNNVADVLLAAAWICGEFAQHVNNVTTVLDAMLRVKLSVVPGALLSVFVQNIAKLYTFQLCKLEADDDWDGVESLDNLLVSKLPEYQYTDHLEAQERTCNLIAMLKFASEMHAQNVKISEALTKHFEGELNPVAAKAQKKVPVPEGLNLDECINEMEPFEGDEDDAQDSGEEEEEEYGMASPHREKGAVVVPSTYSMGQSAVESRKVHRKQSPSAYHGKSCVDANGMVPNMREGKRKQQPDAIPSASTTMTEESRRRRQDELENNPFYVKERPARLLIGTDGIRNGGGTALPRSVVEQQQHGIQSPLEIAGVLGLERYMQQQGSTLSWKEAGKQQKNAKKKTQDVVDEDGLKKRKRRTPKMQQPTGNEADGEAEEGAQTQDNGTTKRRDSGEGGNEAEEHFVYRGDGEMPEGALSSASEEQLDDEFRALNVDLDEALREREESLHAHKTYSRPFGAAPAERSKSGKLLDKKRKKRSTATAEKGDEKNKSPKKRPDGRKSSVGDDGKQQQNVASRKKRLVGRKGSASRNDYTSIEEESLPLPSSEALVEAQLISLADVVEDSNAPSKTEESAAK